MLVSFRMCWRIPSGRGTRGTSASLDSSPSIPSAQAPLTKPANSDKTQNFRGPEAGCCPLAIRLHQRVVGIGGLVGFGSSLSDVVSGGVGVFVGHVPWTRQM